MAKNRPVTICRIRHMPSKDQKFHHAEMFDGLGRSISELCQSKIYTDSAHYHRLLIVV